MKRDEGEWLNWFSLSTLSLGTFMFGNGSINFIMNFYEMGWYWVKQALIKNKEG